MKNGNNIGGNWTITKSQKKIGNDYVETRGPVESQVTTHPGPDGRALECGVIV